MKKVPVLLPFQKTIFQSGDGHSVTSDTEHLVQMVLKDNKFSELRALDLGTGCGIIVIMLKLFNPDWQCLGIDIQPHLIELAIENARLAEVKAEFIAADFRNYNFRDKFDLIVSNPPYQKLNSGRLPPERERALARHEVSCSMIDILKVLDNNLSDSGLAYLIYPESRTAEIEKNTKNVDLMVNDKFISATGKFRRVIFKLQRSPKKEV